MLNACSSCYCAEKVACWSLARPVSAWVSLGMPHVCSWRNMAKGSVSYIRVVQSVYMRAPAGKRAALSSPFSVVFVSAWSTLVSRLASCRYLYRGRIRSQGSRIVYTAITSTQ